jgi:D-glycero-alpha-D-manno-heptose-7-phosphate kinase
LWAYQGHHASAEELAEGACTIEIDRCGKRIGRQDQYIAALGGIRDIRFGPGDRVIAEEVNVSMAERRTLQDQMMLFFTGITRSATAILAEQSSNVAGSLEELDGLRDLATRAADGLRRGSIAAVGEAMRDSWTLKRKLATGVEAGATGAKVTGAGGGGFLVVICPPGSQTAVRESLSHLRELPVRLDRLGSRVVFNVLRDIWS